MKKFIYAITPFCIYSFFVLLFYYVADYLVPTHNMELARYLFALFYLFHALIGVFVLGFIFGKITQKKICLKKTHSFFMAGCIHLCCYIYNRRIGRYILSNAISLSPNDYRWFYFWYFPPWYTLLCYRDVLLIFSWWTAWIFHFEEKTKRRGRD